MATVKPTLTSQPMTKLNTARSAPTPFTVPQHRERHQRGRGDADPGPEQRRCASTGPPHGEAGDRNDRPEHRLSEHHRQRLAPALLDVRVAQGLTQFVRATKKPRHVPGASGHGWRFVPLPGQAMLQCTRLRKAQNYTGSFCTASMQHKPLPGVALRRFDAESAIREGAWPGEDCQRHGGATTLGGTDCRGPGWIGALRQR